MLWLLLLFVWGNYALCPEPRKMKPCTCESAEYNEDVLIVECKYAQSWLAIRHAMQPLRINHTLERLEIANVRGRDNRLKRLFRNLKVGELMIKDSNFVNLKGTLPKSVFRNSTIHSLILSNVGLKRIPSRAMGNIINLYELSLPYNDIINIGHKAFRHQAKLQLLNLSGNRLTRIPSRALRKLKNLEILILNENPINSIKSTDLLYFPSLVGLEVRSALTNIDWDAFVAMPNLQHLSIANNPSFLNNSTIDLFPFFNNLTSIDISECDVPIGALMGLPIKCLIAQQKGEDEIFGQTLAKFPELVELDIQNNHWFSSDLVGNFTYPTILHLDVSMTDADLEVVKSFPNLESIYAEFVTFGKIKENAFVYNKGLKQIYFDHCSIRRINRFAFRPLQKTIESLTLSHNRLRSLSNKTFDGMINLKSLDLSYNHFCDDFNKNRFPLNKNLLYDSSDSLESLNLAGNYLRRIPSQLMASLINLRHINLAGNDVVHLTKELVNNGKLETLNLNNNRIAYIRPDSFEGMNNLKLLNLGYNELRHPAVITVVFPPNMEILKMKAAQIETLTGSHIKHLNQLRVLDLSQNILRIVQVETFDKSSDSLLFMDLSANPLDCSCSLRPFVEWISTKRITVSQQTLCYYPDALRGQNLIARVCWSRCIHGIDSSHFCKQ